MTLAPLQRLLQRLRIDTYILLLVGVVALATLLPAKGAAADGLGHATTAAIALLFFLYGTRLSPREALDGARNWKLHLFVLACTFALFPVLGIATKLLVPSVLSSSLWTGVMFLCVLPSTVQSSIAFTSIARGNIAAAICSATFSNVLGVFLTPILVAIFLAADTGGFNTDSLQSIMLKLLLPFVVGQFARPLVANWVANHRSFVMSVDRGSILLVVYAAFSAGVEAGIWSEVSVTALAWLVVVNLALLIIVLFATSRGARRLGFDREDRIAIVFCGSKKSLASGLPMAAVLFTGQNVALVVLPLMLFHQVQLMWCAALARRYASELEEASDGGLVRAPV